MKLDIIFSRACKRLRLLFLGRRLTKGVIFPLFLFLFPALLSARILLPLDDPDRSRGISDNTVQDIVVHKGAVWMSGGEGVMFKYPGDSVWNLYNRGNGLIADNISAMYSSGDILWVAMNHFEEGSDYATADGLAYTSDTGHTWDTVSSDGTVGFVNIVYDIAGVDSILFCASWFGGLLSSFDNGLNWKHVYFSREDSTGYIENPNDPPFSNRYFAAVADTFHHDSLVLWAGCANGVRRYIYAPDYAKPASNYIFDIASVDSFIFICGDSGLTRLRLDTIDANNSMEIYHSSFVDDGLPGQAVTTAFGFSGYLFIGTIDSLGREAIIDTAGDTADYNYIPYSTGPGLAVSNDNGLTFSENYSGLDSLNGDNRYPLEFASIGHHLFMAAYEAGLFMSSDTGATWSKVYTDILDSTLSNGRNIVHSIVTDSFNLWAGTDSGIVNIEFDSSGNVLSRQNFVFAEDSVSGARSYRVAIQKFTDSVGNVDSTTVWSLNHPVDTASGSYTVYYSADTGTGIFWKSPWGTTSFPNNTPFYDVGFTNNNDVYLTGADVIKRSSNRTTWYWGDAGVVIVDSLDTSLKLNNLNLYSFLVVNDTMYVGSEYGLAISPPGSIYLKWHIVITNTDPTKHDKVAPYYYDHISGNFVNALDIQPLSDGKSLLWASTHPTEDPQIDGISVTTLDGLDWDIRHTGAIAWNFAFDDAAVFAATSSGLLYSPDTGRTWDTLSINGTLATSLPPTDFYIDPETEIYAVEVVDSNLWVGTGEGAASIALDSLGDYGWTIYRYHDPSHVTYAFPNPYSHAQDSRVHFHFYAPGDAYVTVEIYDFAMNLVKKVIDKKFIWGGLPGNIEWDGLNGVKGVTAIGMYYYKISLSTGEVYWGKLAIEP